MAATKFWQAIRAFLVEYDTMMDHARHGRPNPRQAKRQGKDRL